MSSASRARNFRRRGEDVEDDDNGYDSNKPTTAIASSNLSSSKPTAKKPPKLLSFADDVSEEEPPKSSSNRTRDREKERPFSSSRFNKPSSAHKITSTKDRKNTSLLPSNVQPQAGTYTKEALLELQKNTRILAAPSSRASSVSSESKIVLKGLLEPQSQNSNSLQDNAPEQKLDKDDAESRLATMAIGKDVDLDSSAFPNQATIDAIKAKKDRFRKSFAKPAPEYISLDSGSNQVGGADEELSDEEEPEFRGRLFGETGKKGVFEVVEDRAMGGVVSRKDEIRDEDNDGDDDEEKLWEEEQFRKGLGKRLDESSNRVVVSSNTTAGVAVVHSMPQQHKNKFGYSTMASYGSMMPSMSPAPPSSIVGVAVASQGLDITSISQQAEIAKKALQENVRRLKESHTRTMSSLAKADDNLSASLFNITALEKSLSADFIHTCLIC